MDEYDIADGFSESQRLVIAVAASNPARAVLQPAFPGTLTFKPDSGQVPALDPASPSSPPLRGNLVLELSEAKPLLRLRRIPHFGYPVLLAYEGVTLTPDFFATVVAGSMILDPRRTLGRRAGSAQKALAFANGQISIDVSPTKAAVAGTWPSLAIDAADSTAALTLAFGVRTHLNPLVQKPSAVELSYDELVGGPEFAPMPLAFFYGMLRRRGSQEWNDLAATDHAAHPLFDALDRLEDGDTQGRWRRLRLFMPGPRPTTPETRGPLGTLEARGSDTRGTPPWSAKSNRLGEVFAKRFDDESFTLRVVALGPSGTGPGTPIEVAIGVNDTSQASVALQWDADPDAGDAGLDVTAALAVDGDPTDDALFTSLPLGEGMRDKSGVTVDPIAMSVVHDRCLVRPLQKLLKNFGFAIVGNSRDEFDRLTAWALREFQCYAGLPHVATKRSGLPAGTAYAASLQAAANTHPYGGPISGMLDPATAETLRAWRDNGYVCPVVIESREDGTAGANVIKENIWLPADDRDDSHRMFARDVSGYYDNIPAARLANPIPLGQHSSYGRHEGPLCLKESSWTQDTDVTPERLVGRTLDRNDPDDQRAISTYKVIAAVGKAENNGVFDVLNGYDPGVMSLGLSHWTVFINLPDPKLNNNAELPAFLAYVKFVDPNEFTKFFGRFGIELETSWPPATDPKNPLFNSSQAKWGTRVRLHGLGASVKDSSYPSEAGIALTRFDDANYLRNWHWFYRWVMSARTSPTVWRLQWPMTRLRIRALLAAEWPASSVTRHFKSIGQVFSSERAVAAVLRAHVNQPGEILKGGKASDRLIRAVQSAGLAGKDPDTWSATQLAALQQHLEAGINEIDTIGNTLHLATDSIDDDFGPLSRDRNSFQLDQSGIENLR